MKSIPALCVLLFVFAGCTNPNRTPQSGEIASNRALAIDSIPLKIVEQQIPAYLSGFSLALADSQKVLYSAGFGLSDLESSKPFTSGSIQHIASISKTFIGIALMKAHELDLLKIDDPMNDYLPFPVENPRHPEVPITFRHLATHTSSILDTEYYEYSYIYRDSLTGEFPENVLSLESFLEKILKAGADWYSEEGFLERAPGEWFEYSNLGAALAALGIEYASGMPFPEFAKRHIFDPLGMTSSGWSFEDIDLSKHTTGYGDRETPLAPFYLITYPDGGLRTCASDMGKYLSELIRGQAGKGTLLSEESYRTLFTPQLGSSHFAERDAASAINDEYNSGIFMGFTGPGMIGHTGGDPGVVSLMFFDPEKSVGYFFMTNTEIGSQEAYEEITSILEIIDQAI
jgi:CubicO group peptidase (beta-lactamase class C family)